MLRSQGSPTPNVSAATGTLPVANGGTGVTSITASRALVSAANSTVTASATTATELGYVNGVTSAIQTQLGEVAAAGAYIDYLSWSPTNHVLTSTSYVDINGVTNQSLTIPATGNYIAILCISGPYASGGDLVANFGLSIDNATSVDFTATPVGVTTNIRLAGAIATLKTSITAGSRTFKVQAKVSAQTLNFSTGTGALTLTLQRAGS